VKINKGNPVHWLYLVLFGLNVISTILGRPFRRKSNRKLVVLYGHRLTGNLAAIYEFIKAFPGLGMEVTFLALEPGYHRQLQAQGRSSVLALSPGCTRCLVRADAIISDHGLHALLPLLALSNIKFFDVWHGIPFKGFDPDDFRVQHHYDEVWVASPHLQRMYVQRFGFEAEKVQVTGYARTDPLVRPHESARQIRKRQGLPGERKLVLFAPTWKQDSNNRDVLPFGLDGPTFYRELNDLALRLDSIIVMRAHLNTRDAAFSASDHERIIQLPYARHPDTEGILLASDVLVCDWSSIAFDFLLLNRPTVFLDVEPPFAKGFSLGPEYRFGAIARDFPEMLSFLERYIDAPAEYIEEFSDRAAQIRHEIYGAFADGFAARRCVERLRAHLGSGSFSDP